MSVQSKTAYPPSHILEPTSSTIFQPEGAKETQSESDSSPSFAESTYLKIDEQAAKRLCDLKIETGLSEIISWIGFQRSYLIRNSDKISIRDARLINDHSEQPIFEIDKDHLVEFKVTEAARNTLELLYKEDCYDKEELETPPAFLYKIITRHTLSISKKNADKIDEFFHKDVFGSHQIFESACAEDIKKKQNRIDNDKLTLIKYDKKSKEKVRKFDSATNTKISNIIGSIMYQSHYSSINVRNALVVNKVSGSEIFNFSVANLKYVPISDDTHDRFSTSLENKTKTGKVTMRDIERRLKLPKSCLCGIKKRKNNRILYSTADKLNKYFKKKIFDFKQILQDAQQEATRFYESSLPIDTKSETPVSSAQKRKLSQTTIEEGRPIKKQKKALEEMQMPKAPSPVPSSSDIPSCEMDPPPSPEERPPASWDEFTDDPLAIECIPTFLEYHQPFISLELDTFANPQLDPSSSSLNS